jgi:hypothetical protein
MKALTVKQPWADAITHGMKHTENRTWLPPQNTGAHILIHAGAAYDPMGRFVITDWTTLESWPDTRGAIVAVAEIGGVHLAENGCCAPWGQPGVYHWTLEDVIALPEPVPCGGRQKLWTPDDDVLAEVRRQLA